MLIDGRSLHCVTSFIQMRGLSMRMEFLAGLPGSNLGKDVVL
jgi:uncharacterized metal-binding protein